MRAAVRRLPPFLRAVFAVGMLCFIADAGLYAALLLDRAASHEAFFRNSSLFRVVINLNALISACLFYGILCLVVFIARLRQPARRRRFSLDSWRSQALAFAVMAGPALCSLLLALITALSPTVATEPDMVVLVATMWPVIVMQLFVAVSLA